MNHRIEELERELKSLKATNERNEMKNSCELVLLKAIAIYEQEGIEKSLLYLEKKIPKLREKYNF